ncbi:hypothetical protein AB5I41_14590 [Sphingomonas sp. MMS24-JH45]
MTFLPGPPTLFQTLLAMPDRPADALRHVRQLNHRCQRRRSLDDRGDAA